MRTLEMIGGLVGFAIGFVYNRTYILQGDVGVGIGAILSIVISIWICSKIGKCIGRVWDEWR